MLNYHFQFQPFEMFAVGMCPCHFVGFVNGYRRIRTNSFIYKKTLQLQKINRGKNKNQGTDKKQMTKTFIQIH